MHAAATIHAASVGTAGVAAAVCAAFDMSPAPASQHVALSSAGHVCVPQTVAAAVARLSTAAVRSDAIALSRAAAAWLAAAASPLPDTAAAAAATLLKIRAAFTAGMTIVVQLAARAPVLPAPAAAAATLAVVVDAVTAGCAAVT